MVITLGVIVAFVYGSALIWVAFNMTRFLTQLVRPARPPAFVCLHMTAVWTVGIAASLAGLEIILQGMTLLNH